jgi:hypothetical protein
MKKIIYFVYLGLLLFILIACQKENIAPSGPTAAAMSQKVSPSCQTYSYTSKTGVVTVGTVSGTQIIVGFNPTLTLAQKKAIMQRFPKFASFLPGDFNYLPDEVLNFITLKPNTTCAQVEAIRTALESNSNVNVVLLTYQDPNGSLTQYLNGIIVRLKNQSGLAELQQFAQATNTQIVDSIDNLTYLLRVDKNSTSDIFGIISSLNSRKKIEYAEPDVPLILPAPAKTQPTIANAPISKETSLF